MTSENIIETLEILSRLIQNRDVLLLLTNDGYRINWESFDLLIHDLTGRNIIIGKAN